MTTVNVSPTNKNPSHMLKLSAGGTDIGLRPVGEAAGIQEIPFTPSSLKITEGGGKYSDFDMPYSHILQATWSGGRGQWEYNDSARFYDSYCAWTTRDGQALPGPQWCFGSGYRTRDENLWNGKNMNWVALHDTTRYISIYKNATSDADYTGAKLGFWIKRVGTPGTLTAAVYSDAGTPGTPDTELATGTVTTSTITDTASIFYKFSVAQAITDHVLYWLVIYGASTDSATNHWEVGGQTVSASALYKTKTTAGSWSATGTHALYYTYAEADTQSLWGFFRHKEASYAYRNLAADSAPSLYCIGDRGVATAGGASTLTDSTKTAVWLGTRYVGATVLIFNGTGKGQSRQIASHTTSVLTVSPAWGVTPSTDSEYVILGEHHLTTSSIGTHGLTKPVTDVADTGALVWFAQGDKAKVRHCAVSSTFPPTWTADGDTTSVYADKLLGWADPDPTVGPRIWRALRTGSTVVVSHGDGDTATHLETTDFTDAGTLEPFEFPTKLIAYDGKPWCLTHKNAYYFLNNMATKAALGLDAVPDWTNGAGAAVQNLFLYIPWSHSLERFYGSTLDDVGPWEDSGLPSGRTGNISALVPIVGWLVAGIDAGDSGTSSVLVWNGRGWHEIWRAWETGKRVTSLYWEPVMGDRGRLWVGVGDDLVWMEFPLDTLNPANDSAFAYNHEGHIITSWMDAEYAELSKYFKEVSVRADGLASTTTVEVDYQTDAAADSTAWTNAGTADASPQETVTINVGDKKRIRLRFRLLTSVYTTPAKIVATVLKAFARMTVKYQYNVTFHVGHNGRTYVGLPDHDPDTLLNQLESWSESATPLTMRCVLERLDNKTVIVEPPAVARKLYNKVQSWFTGTATVVIREA